MANNRYFLKCPVCTDQLFMGKSLGEGIYNTRVFQGKVYSPPELIAELTSPVAQEKQQFAYGEVLGEIYAWMWKHMIECHRDEFRGGELFSVVSEYPIKTSSPDSHD